MVRGLKIETFYDLVVAFERTGFDTETYNQISEKTLEQIFQEQQERDVTLELIPAANGKPEHIGRSAVTAAITIVDPINGYKYLETGRQQIRSGTVRKKLCSWTITETCRRGYSVTDEAARALMDELDLEVPSEQLYWVLEQEFPDPYPSSVYAGVVTYAMIQRFEWWVTSPPWHDEVKVARDTSKLVFIERIPYKNRSTLWDL